MHYYVQNNFNVCARSDAQFKVMYIKCAAHWTYKLANTELAMRDTTTNNIVLISTTKPCKIDIERMPSDLSHQEKHHDELFSKETTMSTRARETPVNGKGKTKKPSKVCTKAEARRPRLEGTPARLGTFRHAKHAGTRTFLGTLAHFSTFGHV